MPRPVPAPLAVLPPRRLSAGPDLPVLDVGRPDRVAAARVLLARLGVTVDDSQRADRPRVPTMAEYLPQVRAAAGPGTPTRQYGPDTPPGRNDSAAINMMMVMSTVYGSPSGSDSQTHS